MMAPPHKIDFVDSKNVNEMVILLNSKSQIFVVITSQDHRLPWEFSEGSIVWTWTSQFTLLQNSFFLVKIIELEISGELRPGKLIMVRKAKLIRAKESICRGASKLVEIFT